jgi:hypothetical protein
VAGSAASDDHPCALIASVAGHIPGDVLGEAVHEHPARAVSLGVAEDPFVGDDTGRPEVGLHLATAQVVTVEALAKGLAQVGQESA